MDGKTAFANILAREGVDVVFCFPNNILIDACAAAGIRPIISRMERTAVNMADAYSRVNNGDKNGVVLVQGGPGIENAFSRVAQAYADSSPLLMVPNHPGTRRHGMSSDFDAARNYEGVTKWAGSSQPHRAHTGVDASRVHATPHRPAQPGTGRNAQRRPGREISEEQFHYLPQQKRRSAGDPRDISRVAELLVNSRRPVIYAGQGVLYAEATPELVELAELLNAPTMTTTLGKSGFPENHPLALGAGGNTGTKMVGEFLAKSDVVFGIGTSFQKTLASAPVPSGKTVIQSTIDEKDLNGEYPLDEIIVGDAKLVLGQLIEEVKDRLGEKRPARR